MGPVQMNGPKFGECRECWDENWCHTTHKYFHGRQRMVGKVCGHRLVPIPAKLRPNFRYNEFHEKRREKYWRQRTADDCFGLDACLPDYCPRRVCQWPPHHLKDAPEYAEIIAEIKKSKMGRRRWRLD